MVQSMFVRAAFAVALTIAFASSALAQSSSPFKIEGCSNIRLTFSGAAAGHFGEQPIEGVVTLQR